MRKLVFVPILFFASFLVVLYVVIPNYVESSALQGQIEIKEQEVKDKQEYFTKLQLISDNLEQYQEFLDKIEKALPQKISLASLLAFFQSKALGSGLVMENLSPSPAAQQTSSQDEAGEGASEKIEETDFRLIVSGPFVSFENFLRTLEKSSRLVEVARVSFDEGEQGTDEGVMNFEFDLSLKVYSYFLSDE